MRNITRKLTICYWNSEILCPRIYRPTIKKQINLHLESKSIGSAKGFTDNCSKTNGLEPCKGSSTPWDRTWSLIIKLSRLYFWTTSKIDIINTRETITRHRQCLPITMWNVGRSSKIKNNNSNSNRSSLSNPMKIIDLLWVRQTKPSMRSVWDWQKP